MTSGGSEVGRAFVSLLPSAKGFGRSMDRQIGPSISSSGKRYGGRFGSVFATASIRPLRAIGTVALGFFAAQKIGAFFKGAFDEAREAQKVTAQTNAVIKSTGGVANVSAKALGNLSTAISNKVGIDDEAIQSAGNMLLTFTNVRNEAGKGNKVFNQTVQAATDMSVAMGTDARSAALQLGKALNDPTKGLTKLQRQGVTFTDEQKNQISAMQKSGNLLGAQKVILREVAKEFGGSAAAQATAGDKAKVAFKNLEEAVGTALLPVFDALLNKLTPVITSLTNGVAPAVAKVQGFVTRLFSAFQSSGGADKAAGIFTQIKGAVSAVLPTIQKLAQAFVTNLLPILAAAAQNFQTKILPAIIAVASYVGAKLLPVFKQVGAIIANNVLPIISKFGVFFYSKVLPAVIAIASAIAIRLKPVFDQLVATLQTTVLPAVQRLFVKFQQYQPAIQRIISVVIRVVGVLLIFAATVLARVLPPLIRFAGFILGHLIGAIGTIIGIAIRVVSAVIRIGTAFVNVIRFVIRFQTAVVTTIGRVVKFVSGIPGRIVHALGNLGSLLYNAGKELVGGLIRGIEAKIGALVAKMHELASKVKGFLPGSPVKTGPLTAWNGGAAGKRLVDQGIIAGINSRGPALTSAMSRLSSRVQVGSPTAGGALGIADAAAAAGSGSWTLIDKDGDLIGTMEGVADSRFYANQSLQVPR